MKKREKISEAVIKRLPIYYHCLKWLENDGITRVSSNIISGMLNVTASQVRQDFSNFGEFGQQGYGYDVAFLKNQIAAILGLDKRYNVIVIGAGRIGEALASYKGFKNEGFDFIAAFDIDTKGRDMIGDVPLYHYDKLEEFAKDNRIDIAVIAIPAESCKEVAAFIKKLDIKSIWNFAPVFLYMGEDIAVENINMSESLFMLVYKANNLIKEK
ncbi:MAG: redox-sensing transcriptional repressor Rex [Clostridiales bacterium]|nr:redox-sensing transcriptional repressor Rex [Clostridiales bacterium]